MRDGEASSPSDRFIVWSGILLPIVVLAGLLTYGLILTGTRTASASPDALHIEVTGEQWWWRVRYAPDSEEVVETANELRIPVGRDVELRPRGAATSSTASGYRASRARST